MTREEMLERVHLLEKELELLRERVEPETSMNRYVVRLKRAYRFVVSNWTAFSVLGAILVGFYVWDMFGIDYYFDSYRNTANSRRLAEFYCCLGDRFMTLSEWDAAEDAYRKALEINRNNLDATYGIVKAEVFQPVGKEHEPAPAVISTKLKYLAARFPDDHQVDYLKGLFAWKNGDSVQAKQLWESSAKKYERVRKRLGRDDMEEGFVGAYVMLGNLSLVDNDLPNAIKHTELAVRIAPDHPTAVNNLGYCYLLSGRDADAVKFLSQAFNASSAVLTALNLGDAYLNAGDLDQALYYHQYALKTLNDPKNENERLVGYTWTYHVPQAAGQPLTQPTVFVGTVERKKAFVCYELSLDYAALGDFADAEKMLTQALLRDTDKEYLVYFIARAHQVTERSKLEPGRKEWFVNIRKTMNALASAPSSALKR